MVDLLDEVKDDIREQRTLEGVKLFGKVVLIALVISLISVAGWSAYKDYSQKVFYEEGRKYNLALLNLVSDKGKTETALSEFEKVFVSAKTNYGALAGFQIAQINLAQKNFHKTSEVLNKIASSEHVSRELRDYANVIALSVDYEQGKIQPVEFIQKLEEISAKDNFLKLQAEEILAVALIEAKEFKRALQYLSLIRAGSEATSGAAVRAIQLERLALIGG